MKLYLLKDQPTALLHSVQVPPEGLRSQQTQPVAQGYPSYRCEQLFDAPRVCNRITLITPNLSVSPHSTPRQKEYCAQLRKRIGESKCITVEIITTKVEPSADTWGHRYPHYFVDEGSTKKKIMGEIGVSGDLLKHLVAFSTFEQERKIMVKVKIDNIHIRNGIPQDSDSGLRLATEYMCLSLGMSRVNGNVPGSRSWATTFWNSWGCSFANVWGNLSISVLLDGLDDLEGNLMLGKETVYERMLKEEVATDAAIVAGNGVHINCHKSLLMVHSPVLVAMFQSGMEEATTNTIEMPAMTEKSVRAFLAFLYYMDTSEAINSSDVAFELFEAGHKYDIKGLEDSMKNILLTKPFGWFSVPTALRLFLFARNLEGSAILKGKAAEVLKMCGVTTNFKELKESPSFQQLFQDFPQAAMDLYECSVTN